MTGALIGALLAGLAGSPHCVLMCGGFATGAAAERGGVWLWHAGKLTTYAFLGALAGAVGASIPGPRWIPAAVAALLLGWFALALGGFVREPHLTIPGLVRFGRDVAQRPGPTGRYLFGVATGFLPCGLVYSALSVPVALATPLAGALAMVAFGLGTMPALTVVAGGLRRLTAQGLWARRTVAAVVLLAGLWAIASREGLIPHAAGGGGHPGHVHQP